MLITVKALLSVAQSSLRGRPTSAVVLAGAMIMFSFSALHAASGREREVTIAAADSRAAAKAAANYVCTGTNDELVVQRAIDDCAVTGRNLFLYAGLYRFDAVYDFKDGGPRSAIVIRNMRRDFEIRGEGRYVMGWSKKVNVNGVIFSLSEKALPDDGESVDIVRGEWSRQGIMNGSALRLENLTVWAPDSQHNLRALDLRRVMSVEVCNVRLYALGNALLKGLKYPYGNPPAPVVGNIGLTMTDGSNTVPANFVNVCATGFGQGFQPVCGFNYGAKLYGRVRKAFLRPPYSTAPPTTGPPCSPSTKTWCRTSASWAITENSSGRRTARATPWPP